MKRLTKSATDKQLSGVCAGLANYFDIDPTVVRAGAVVASFMTGLFPMLAFYIISAVVMPDEQGTFVQ